MFVRVSNASTFHIIPELFDYNLSDHKLLSLKINKMIVGSNNLNSSFKPPQSRINSNKLKMLLANENWSNVFLVDDIDCAFNNFMTTLNKYINESKVLCQTKKTNTRLRP